MRPTAQIYRFPPPRADVARPGAPFQILAQKYQAQLRDARAAIRNAVLGAIVCGAVALMCAITAYALYVSAIIAQSTVLWSFATAMLIVGGFFVHIGWREYREYGDLLQLYRGVSRNA